MPPPVPPQASAAAASRPAATGPASLRLQQLKSKARRPGEASFFWYDTQFRCEAVKVLPGEYFVSNEDILVMTTLGSCIAACLWDRKAQVGGLNHFMLPDGGADAAASGAGRYGSFAMEVLINELLKRGATRATLEAKVFGGGQVIAEMASLNVGERNTRFVLDYLRAERIAVVSKDVLGSHPRKVCFLPASGKAMIKRLTLTHAPTLLDEERKAAQLAARTASNGGSIELF
jgi:chemotaxis protein CheD